MDSSNDFAVGYAVGDNAANRNCGYGYGNGGMWGMEWLFALLILPAMFGGNGFFGNRNGEPVTESGLCNAMNFNNLENAVGRMSDQQSAIARQTDNAICNLGYETLRNFNSLEQQLAACCCETKQMVLENRYLAEKNAADTNATIIAQVQSVKDLLCQQEAARKDARIWQLELNQAMCGVVRYPLQTTYSTNCNPFFGGGYGYGDGCGRCCGNGNI